MAVKAMFGSPGAKKTTKKERAKDTTMKPLAKVYVECNPDKDGTSHFVFQARLTQKGFLLVLCKEFSLLMPGGTEEASILLDSIFPKLHGTYGNRLVVVLDALNRFGGYLGTDSEHQCHYAYDSDEEVLLTSKEPFVKKEQKKPGILTLEDFNIVTESNTTNK